MKRWLLFVSVLAFTALLGGAVNRLPKALSEVDAFRVQEIRLRGTRFLTQDEAEAALALEPEASVWDDLKPLEARLRDHPLVEDVTIHRRFPHSLLLRVSERVPVALFPNPTLEPVDGTGRILPIDPAEHRLDLPIMAAAGTSAPGDLTTSDLRILAGEIVRLAQGDPELHARISDFALHPRGDVRARLSDPPVTLHFMPGLPSGRIQEGLRVLDHAQARFAEGEVAHLDLRWKDQVVVRFGRVGGR